ncbi:hypothetical protein [Poseidonibacter antarcticus]|uniref:hypothetical protein n=1 Tax=Poseidonibacter antarcticus TaxID=2478538 RepID=UPI0013CEDC2B|nr:hypothetical protein [Poseidonibacter antarcticus]
MKKLVLSTLMLGLLSMSAYAITGFLKGEQISGMNKFCYYSNDTIITVKSYELCPLSN